MANIDFLTGRVNPTVDQLRARLTDVLFEDADDAAEALYSGWQGWRDPQRYAHRMQVLFGNHGGGPPGLVHVFPEAREAYQAELLAARGSQSSTWKRYFIPVLLGSGIVLAKLFHQHYLSDAFRRRRLRTKLKRLRIALKALGKHVAAGFAGWWISRYQEAHKNNARVQLLCNIFWSGVGAQIAIDLLSNTVNQPDVSARTQLMLQTAEQPVRKPHELRPLFNDRQLENWSKPKNHTHPVSARDRSIASAFCEKFCVANGLRPFYYQMSASDQRKGREGSRDWRWVKDLVAPPRRAEPLAEDQVLVMIDVDYYLEELPEMLSEEFVPVLMYTIVPQEVAYSGPEISFQFTENNELAYDVSGGGSYKHKLWNWCSDALLVEGSDYIAAYLVDRKVVAPHREIVLLTPLNRWLKWEWNTTWLQGTRLRRLEPNQGLFNLLSIRRAGAHYVSIARVGGYASATITHREFDCVRSVAKASKVALSLGVCLSKLDDPKNTAAGTLLFDYFRNNSGEDAMQMVYPVEAYAHNYVAAPGREHDGEEKPSMEAFMRPLVDGSFSPALCEANERRAVHARVESVRPGPLILSQRLSDNMTEFVRFLTPTHKLFPVDEETVWERQSRPSQRSILERASAISHLAGSAVSRVTQTFLKRESYDEPKSPRIISTIEGSVKRDYSRFTYALSEHLKAFHWYAFSRSPRAIAERVAEICATAESFVVETDFSRFDGRVSNVLRELETRAMMACFDPLHATELLKLMRSQYDLTGYMPTGVMFKTGLSRSSGSPETSVFNTLANAFVAYCALRDGRSSAEAWDRLGIYGGDDGLTPDAKITTYMKVASDVGQKLKANVKNMGDRVTFLARIYSPHVWTRDPDSCADLHRQLCKLHVTTRLNPGVTPVMKLCEKLRNYVLDDANTPVLGDMALAFPLVEEEVPDLVSFTRHYSRAYHTDLTQEHYPNENRLDWMSDLVLATGFDYARFRQDLAETKCLADLLNLPGPYTTVVVPDVNVRTSMGDVVIEPADQTAIPTPVPKSERRRPAPLKIPRERELPPVSPDLSKTVVTSKPPSRRETPRPASGKKPDPTGRRVERITQKEFDTMSPQEQMQVVAGLYGFDPNDKSQFHKCWKAFKGYRGAVYAAMERGSFYPPKPFRPDSLPADCEPRVPRFMVKDGQRAVEWAAPGDKPNGQWRQKVKRDAPRPEDDNKLSEETSLRAPIRGNPPYFGPPGYYHPVAPSQIASPRREAKEEPSNPALETLDLTADLASWKPFAFSAEPYRFGAPANPPPDEGSGGGQGPGGF